MQTLHIEMSTTGRAQSIRTSSEVGITEKVQGQVVGIVPDPPDKLMINRRVNIAHQLMQSLITLAVPTCDAFGEKLYCAMQVETPL